MGVTVKTQATEVKPPAIHKNNREVFLQVQHVGVTRFLSKRLELHLELAAGFGNKGDVYVALLLEA